MRRTRRRGIGHEAEGGRAVLVMVLVLGMLAMGGWGAAYAGASGNVPRGTTVAGVDIGGRDRYAAVRALAAGAETDLTTPMSVSIGTVTAQVTPQEAGLSVDYVESVARAVGPRSWDPRRLWGYYNGGGRLDPVVNVDSARMEATLARLDLIAGQPARDGAISLSGGSVDATEPKDGAQIDHDQARAEIVEAWAAGRQQVNLPLAFTAPDIDADDLDTAVRTLANPALSGPVTLAFAGSQTVLAPQDFADLVTITPRDGALALDVDPAALAARVDPAAHDTLPVDATVALTDGLPAVVPAVDGQSYDETGVAAAFLQAVVADGAARTVAVQGTAGRAAFGTRAARRLGVSELVATFSVPAPASAGPRFDAAVARLSGALVRPGETFSFNGRVGTVERSGTRLASATWNAGFLAGLTDVARTAPPTLTDGLPEGRDATVAVGGADLQMRNDSGHGVLLTARAEAGAVVVDAWSTMEYDVATSTGARYAVTPRAVVTDASPTCVAQDGADGFAVDLVRTVSRVGDPAPVRSDTVTTTYAPVSAVVCQAAVPPL